MEPVHSDAIPFPGAHPLGGYSKSYVLLGLTSNTNIPTDEQYVYEPLPVGGEYVRLLEITPGQTEPLYSLRIFLLNGCFGNYEALSYVWGNPYDRANIKIDGKILSITINLSHALRALVSDGKTRRLWIDAVCVNQEDLDERSQQVRLMRKIYERSSGVPIWLGNDNTVIAEECMNLLKDTARISRALLTKYDRPFNIPNPMAENPICTDQKKWALVHELTELPWFSRVWVLQEAGLAPRATLIWGRQMLDFSDLVEVGLLHSEAGHLFVIPVNGLFRISDTFYDLWRTFTTPFAHWRSMISKGLIQSTSVDRSPITLAEILHIGRRFKATDLRDYVFAFLGHPTAVDPVTYEPLINPNYNKPLLEVYYEAGRALLRTCELTFFLSCVDRDQAALDDAFPSWVPQWHLAKYVSALGYPVNRYRAGGYDKNPIFSVDENRRRLKIRGFILDTILWAANAMTDEDFDFLHTDRHPSVIEKIWTELRPHDVGPERRYSDEEKIEAFSVTLTADAVQLKDQPPGTMDQLRRSFKAYCVKFGCTLVPGFDPEFSEAESWGFERRFWWAALNRRFFRTKTGWYGLAHKLIREGDVCCVFEGVRVPFVLRPVDGEGYKLVGDAYVHGVMRGEAVTMMKNGSFVEEDIIIV
ncbi:HET-domain-containing protein [Hypoxylon sp. EC38]|nr:HET-domain-containing protein [Hypoxylon sp. EC38]